MLAFRIGVGVRAVYDLASTSEHGNGADRRCRRPLDGPDLGTFADVYADDAASCAPTAPGSSAFQAIQDDAARLTPVDFAVERVATAAVEATTDPFVHSTSRVQEGTRLVVAELEYGSIAGLVLVEPGLGLPARRRGLVRERSASETRRERGSPPPSAGRA